MEHDLVIISSSNRIYGLDRCFEVSMGSNVFCVGDKISWNTGNACRSVGTIIANPSSGNYLILKEEANA